MLLQPGRASEITRDVAKGQPVDAVAQTPDEVAFYNEVKPQIEAIASAGGIVDTPYDDMEYPDDFLQDLYADSAPADASAPPSGEPGTAPDATPAASPPSPTIQPPS